MTIKEINWEARSKWSETKLNEYRYVSKKIKEEFKDTLQHNQMLDLESIVILDKEEFGYRTAVYIRRMNGNTILGSVQVLVNVPYEELTIL